MKNKFIFLIMIFVFVMSSCSPNDSQIATAIAKTQLAEITDTPFPTNTREPTTTNTITPSPTFTITPTYTPTYTPTPDTRVIDVNPQKMILERSELPSEGKFYLYNSTPHRNFEVISVRGRVAGTKYIDKTGRVDGWIIEYLRGTSLARVPDYVVLYPVLYKTASGSDYVMHESGHPCNYTDNIKYDPIKELAIGDESYICFYKEMQSSGVYYIEYWIPIVYRNVFFGIQAGGDIDTFDEEWVIDITEKQIEKLKSFPLSNKVTWTP